MCMLHITTLQDQGLYVESANTTQKVPGVCSCLPAAQMVCQDPEAGCLRVAA